MKYLDIIVPVKNERENIVSLVKRIDASMRLSSIEYTAIFIDDNSDDGTFELLLKLKQDFPLEVFKKKGKPGKAFSILEGVKVAKGEYLAMIDGDLQYPPEKIPEMFEKLQEAGVVVAKRKLRQGKLLRKVSSIVFNYTFGKFLFGFDADIQSGLKLFKKEIIEYISEKDVSPWTLDLPLLLAARETGHKIQEVEIEFGKRRKGQSKISFFKASAELGFYSLKTKLSRRKVYKLSPEYSDSMVGAGVIHRGKRFITHTTLEPDHSAVHTLTFSQKLFMYGVLGLIGFGLIMNSLLTIQAVIAILSFVYFIDVLFNFFLIFKSLHFPPEIIVSEQHLSSIKDSELPIYSILCPLYKEASVLPHFLDAISKIEWPKGKLDVLLLLEEDDIETIEEAKRMDLPDYVRTIIVPNSNPKTKPKACNFGLTQAKGEYLVIYDAEDIPDPLQLKKAYAAFKRVPRNVVCLQAKLNYHNPHQNFLTRLFTAEYSLWFDVILTGLQSIETTIPLGGTSNHFRTKDLLSLEGWDPFNVTEDCDLGMRLFQNGYKTAIIDSTTLEEANSKLGNWVRQRSRWIKGYMQTYLVHMRNPIQLVKKQGWHALIFQLLVGGKIAFMFINPFLWVTTIAYFSFRSIVGPSIEAVYPPYVFYMAAFSLVFGNFLFLYYYMIGCAKREHWSLIKFVYLVPFYWLMVSWAACIAFYQLIFKPHYWEKTVHGLHLKSQKIEEVIEAVPQKVVDAVKGEVTEGWPQNLKNKIKGLFTAKQLFVSGLIFMLANVLAGVANFAFNTYLGRAISIEEFGIISLFSSFFFIVTIPLGALGSTITKKSAYLLGSGQKDQALAYLLSVNKRTVSYALLGTLLWLVSLPLLAGFFKVESFVPFLVFTPVWILGSLTFNIGGYMRGLFMFRSLSLLIVISALSKFFFALILVDAGFEDIVLFAIPWSMVVELLLGWYFVSSSNKSPVRLEKLKFDWPFFVSSMMVGISTISFLALDVILAKHYLNPLEAGQYGLLSLVGKIAFFLTSLVLPFLLPIVARNKGANLSSRKEFLFLFGVILLISSGSLIGLGAFGFYFVPLLFGDKTLPILPLLPLYVLTISLFSIVRPVVSYFQAKDDHTYVLAGFLVTVFQILLVFFFHQDLAQFVYVMFAISLLNIFSVAAIFLLRKYFPVHIQNLIDSSKLLFLPVKESRYKTGPGGLNILILNWYDIKHVWGGGAELYLHNIAKRFVNKGNKVTIFCGNDGHSAQNEVIDGITIYRRGGLYSVAIWAFIYYIVKFRGKFDIVIDNAKGVPFFTPYYVRKPKIGLIHHIHQEMFRTSLKFPLKEISLYLEGTLMPKAYKNTSMVTVSPSSKKAMEEIGFGQETAIKIINPGVEIKKMNVKKTKYPSVVFLGRLRSYKCVDVLIKSLVKVKESNSDTRLMIVGSGEEMKKLEKLTHRLNLTDSVKFLGKVTELEKRKLFSESWVSVQPSLAEGWGITVIEANACGTPVIASDVDGLKDSVLDGKTGVLVPVKNVDALSGAIVKLINDRKYMDELSTNAYTWSQNFSWDKCADNFFEAIEQEIKRDKTPSTLKGWVLAE